MSSFPVPNAVFLQAVLENLINPFFLLDVHGEIRYSSPSVTDKLGYLPQELMGTSIFDLVHPDYQSLLVQNLADVLNQPGKKQLGEAFMLADWQGDWHWMEATLINLLDHSEIAGIVLKCHDVSFCKLSEAHLRQEAERERLLIQITRGIHQSLDLQMILATTVRQIRQLLAADRVLIYRFLPNSTGTVAMESVGSDWRSVLGQDIADDCFAESYKARYPQGRLKVIDDIFTAELEPCHREFLRFHQVRASMVVPIVNGQQLWGLLIIHQCDQPRQWQPWEINLLGQLSPAVAIAIHQAELHQKLQLELTKHSQTEAVLLQSETRFRAAAEVSLDALFIMKCLRDERGEIIDFIFTDLNSRAEKLVAKERQQLMGRRLSYLIPIVKELGLLQKYIAVVQTGQGLEEEFAISGPQIQATWLRQQVVPLGDGIAITSRDVSDRKQAEKQLVYQAFYDSLTALPNRALFIERLQKAIQKSQQQEGYLYAVLFLDLDRFKVINDSLGHQLGNEFLTTIAQRLTHQLRVGDMVARMGGDEFALLLEDIEQISDAIGVAERIQASLSRPLVLNRQEVFSSASIGIVMGSKDYLRPEALLRDADIAMYQAKAQGKARYALFDTQMHAQALQRLQLETDLRRAAERGDFQLVYQPIIRLDNSSLSGFEALIRWIHPEQGVISPTVFIPVAEETGLILTIGQWVLQQACQQLRQWQTQFAHRWNISTLPLKVNVNISSKQFSQPDLPQQVAQVLSQAGLSGSYLQLELTESVLMENIKSAAKVLSQFRKMGIKVTLDDFGTGYSSLSYLHCLPLDGLKIDRSFISKGEKESISNLEITRAILSLSSNLKMQVTAEGIETLAQLKMLKSLNCTYGQGYLLSRPLTAEAAEQFIHRHYCYRESLTSSAELILPNYSAG